MYYFNIVTAYSKHKKKQIVKLFLSEAKRRTAVPKLTDPILMNEVLMNLFINKKLNSIFPNEHDIRTCNINS